MFCMGIGKCILQTIHKLQLTEKLTNVETETEPEIVWPF